MTMSNRRQVSAGQMRRKSRGLGRKSPRAIWGANLLALFEAGTADDSSGLSWPSFGGSKSLTMAQAAGSNAPTLTAAGGDGPAGGPYVSLVDATDLAPTATFGHPDTTDAYTILVVCRAGDFTRTGGGFCIRLADTGDQLFFGRETTGADTDYVGGRFGGVLTPQLDCAQDTWVAGYVGLDPTALTFRYAGAEATAAGRAVDLSNNDATLRIGGTGAGNGDIADLALVALIAGQGTIPAAQRAKINPWLLANYGVTI